VTLRGERVTLRPVAEEDFPRLLEILREPEVREWWGDYDGARLHADYFEGESRDRGFVILDGDEIVGLVSYWEENEPDYRHAGMDIFLAPDRHGQNLGADALRTLARHLIDERGHHRLTIDPAVENTRAIRAYEKLGFRPVGVMRQVERSPDGTWRDGLLMDLLADELRA
jgi:aminoglycoside 6'-N-acetyltransferase